MPYILLLSFLAATVAAALGYRARALSPGGALAATLVGGTIFGLGGVAAALLLVLFFASSSFLSFVKAADSRKRAAAEMFEKGGRRDAMQVVANGGVAAALAIPCFFASGSLREAAFAALVGSLAAATADTWATEIGVLSTAAPRLITTGRAVAPGTSGAVSLLGSAAAAAGSLFLGLAAAILLAIPATRPWDSTSIAPFWFALCGLLGGLAGSFFDSLLGATLQASYFCPACSKPTESRVHRCGTPALLVRGARWMDNDLVNLSATLAGALAGSAAWWLVYNVVG